MELEILSPIIALVAMVVTIYFLRKTMKATRKQIRLQRWLARQDLRNHARTWADEVVAVLQEGITHCFVLKGDHDDTVTSHHFTRLAGKMSELIHRSLRRRLRGGFPA